MARRAATPENFEYKQEKLFKQLDELEIIQEGSRITTKYCGKIVKGFTVSKKYHNFDIKNFIKQIVPTIDTEMDSYNFRIMGGIQELRLLGKVEKIGGDIYKRAFYLLNSTDESRTLQMSFGLYRQVCSNGMLLPESLMSVNTRHYESTLMDRVNEFTECLGTLDDSYQKQIKLLESLSKKEVPMSLIAKHMNKTKTGVSKFNSLRHKLVNSTSDRLSDMTDEQMKVMKANIDQIEKKKYDMNVNAYKALQCYSEIFRNRDSQEIRREIAFFLDLINLA